MNRSVILIVAGTLLCAAGCMDSRTTLLVQKDGSGTVQQTVYYREAPMPMGMPAQQPKLSPEQELQMLQQQCTAAAQKMGEGVSLKSAERLQPRGEWKGAKVVFAFADVNKLKLGSVAEVGPFKSQGDGAIRFEFQKGDPAKLTVILPPMTPPPQAGAGPAQPDMPGADEMINAMLAAMLQGSRIDVLIKVDGRITETDATYVNPRRDAVGLIRADLDGLSKDPAAMQALKAFQKIKDPKVIQEKLQEGAIKKHIRFETKPKIEIEFN